MVRLCYVKNCRVGRRNLDLKSRKVIALFRVPQNEKLFNIWKEAIPCSDRELEKNDFICEYHFENTDILRYFITPISDGVVHAIKRDRLRLRKGAIPSIFPGPPRLKCTKTEVSKHQRPFIIKALQRIDSIDSKEQVVRFGVENDQTNILNTIPCVPDPICEDLDVPNVLQTLEDIASNNIMSNVSYEAATEKLTISCFSNTYEVNVRHSELGSCEISNDGNICEDQSSDSIWNTTQNELLPDCNNTQNHGHLEDPKISSIKKINDHNTLLHTCDQMHSVSDSKNMKEVKFSFDTLVTGLENIKKPNSLWKFVVIENNIICSKWDVKTNSAEERIIIDDSLCIKVNFKGKTLVGKSIDRISSVHELSNLIELIDCYV